MKKFLMGVVAAVSLVFGMSVFADTKIGVVDLNKVMVDSPQVEAAKKQLKDKFDLREKKLVEAQKDFQSEVEKFSKESPTMKDDVKKAAQQKLVDKQKKMQEDQAKFQSDLNTAQNDALKDIVKKIEAVVSKIATDKKFDLVVAKASTAYNKPEFDITSEVISQMKK